MSKNKSVNTDVYEVKLAKNQMPKMIIDQTKNIVKYGPGNDFPAYLLFLQKNHPVHGGIVKGKARYLTGTKIKSKTGSVQGEAFLKNANPLESWIDVKRNTDVDETVSGGYFMKIVSNLIGTPLQWYHIPWAMCRISPCQQFVSYSEDWLNTFKHPITVFPVYREGVIGTSVFVFKAYSSNETKLKSTYAEPEYISATLDIDTDIRIGTFGNSLVKNNFSAGTVVTIYNGETDKDKKREQAEALKFNHEGEDNAGKTVTLFATKDAKSTEVLSVNTNDQDKLYLETGKRNQQNILTAHNVPGILFKIKTEGQLGGRTELVEAHELFLNEYVKIKQEPQLKIIEKFFTLKTGLIDEFEIDQVESIGLELPLDNQTVVAALNAKNPNIIVDYLIYKYGIKIPETLDSTGQPVKENAASVNDNLKGLSAAENADAIRIVRDYKKGRMNEAMAISRVMSYGLTDPEARKWLEMDSATIQQSEQDRSNIFFELFNKYSHEINFEDEIVDTKIVNFKSIRDAVRFEDNAISQAQLQDSVLNTIKGNPSISQEDLAKQNKIDLEQLAIILSILAGLGYILSATDLTPTEKGLNKTTENTEVYTEYVYAKRPDVNGEIIIPTTREFCKNLVDLTKKKALKFEAINQLENDFGENVWDYRGGFYTKPGTNDTTPWCRHIWSAVTRIRRAKK